MNFAERLRDLRTQRGLSQIELAKKLGLSNSTISMYERGEREPDFETLDLIGDFFNVDVNYLLTEGESTGGSAKPEDAATQTGEITIVNTNESTSLKVEKDWDDLGPSTPYEITFTLQKKTTKGDWTDAYDYKMTFNGSTYTIVNLQKDQQRSMTRM